MGSVAAALTVSSSRQRSLMAMKSGVSALVRTRASEVSQVGRNTQGVALMRVGADEKLIAVERLDVIAGEEDPATPVAHAELSASRIPGARLHTLERAAHLANVERAEAFTGAVLEHLGQEVPV